MNKKIHETNKNLNTTKIANHTVTTTSGCQTLDTAKWPQLRSPCALLTSQMMSNQWVIMLASHVMITTG